MIKKNFENQTFRGPAHQFSQSIDMTRTMADPNMSFSRYSKPGLDYIDMRNESLNASMQFIDTRQDIAPTVTPKYNFRK